MRYNQIRTLDISNGDEVGIALFVQGCRFHCKDCFNQETWDFNGGKEWTEETEKEFLRLADRPYIKRISLLGGEPLSEENLDSVLELLKKIRILFGNTKTVWLYTGYTWEDITYPFKTAIREYDESNKKRELILSYCNILVDGQFETDKKDASLPFRGSTNQRLINVKETLKKGEIVLWIN